MHHQRGRALKKATLSSTSAKLINNQRCIYSIFFEELWWNARMRPSGPRESLKCPVDCPAWREMQSSLELSDKTLRVSGSKLIDDYGQQDHGGFRNSIDTNGRVHFLILLSPWLRKRVRTLCIRLLKHPCNLKQVSSLRQTHNIKRQFTSFL